MNKKNIVGGSLLLVLGLFLAWYFLGEDPALAEVNKLRDEFAKNEGPPSQEQRAAMRAEMEKLTDAQRRQFFEQNRPEFEAQMAARFKEFMSRPPEEIRRELADKVMEGRAERAERQASGEGRGGGDRGDRPERTDAERDQRAKERLDRFPPDARAQFGQLRGMVNKELESRGEDPLGRSDMRDMMRGIGGGGPPGGGRGGRGPG